MFAKPIQTRASEQRGYPDLAFHGGCATARQRDAVRRTIVVRRPLARSEAALASRGEDCQNRMMSQQGRAEEIPNLVEYLIEDTGEDQQAWELIKDLPVLRKLGWAVSLKILLPIERLAGSGDPESNSLIHQWEKAYSWLSNRERTDLKAYDR